MIEIKAIDLRAYLRCGHVECAGQARKGSLREHVHGFEKQVMFEWAKRGNLAAALIKTGRVTDCGGPLGVTTLQLPPPLPFSMFVLQIFSQTFLSFLDFLIHSSYPSILVPCFLHTTKPWNNNLAIRMVINIIIIVLRNLQNINSNVILKYRWLIDILAIVSVL